jgi:hypothetical protein
VFPDEATWEPNTVAPNDPGEVEDPVVDNVPWGSRRDEMANLMWNNRGNYHV